MPHGIGRIGGFATPCATYTGPMCTSRIHPLHPNPPLAPLSPNLHPQLGAGKKAPVSARHLRAWSDANQIPPTPKSGRTTGRSARGAAKYGNPANTPHTSDRMAKIKARSAPKE